MYFSFLKIMTYNISSTTIFQVLSNDYFRKKKLCMYVGRQVDVISFSKGPNLFSIESSFSTGHFLPRDAILSRTRCSFIPISRDPSPCTNVFPHEQEHYEKQGRLMKIKNLQLECHFDKINGSNNFHNVYTYIDRYLKMIYEVLKCFRIKGAS